MDVRVAERSLQKPVGRPWRPAGFAILLAGCLAAAAPAQPGAAADLQLSAEKFEARPQWVGAGNIEAATRLITLLETSSVDGLDPKSFKIKTLKRAVRAADRGRSSDISKANDLLDGALIAYVAALRQAPRSEWIVNDKEAIPKPRPAAELLAQAASFPSLGAWIDSMPFMHHSYAGLRRALLLAGERGDRRSQELLRLNLQRARFLPDHGRYVMVNTAAQRLYMYEDGRVVDWMRVVVGKPHQPTPMMAATIKFTALNPYWNVPADLAAERVAPNVVKEGIGYLRHQGYVVLSSWGGDAKPVNPSTIDWQAVADGRTQVRLRQSPGPNNAMGRMKFMFPNPQGIYLHDTPNKELLNEDARLFSGGCVRLEDAQRLAKWLYGKPLSWKGAKTEQPVELEKPVPVYLAYLTAVPTGDQVFYFKDIYGKDSSQLAAQGQRQVAAR